MFFVAGITGAKINSVKPLSKKTGEHEISYQALPRFPEQNVERNSTGKEGDQEVGDVGGGCWGTEMLGILNPTPSPLSPFKHREVK